MKFANPPTTADQEPSGIIRSISVDGLFGLYSYKIPQEGALSNAAILYGDNGIGKSTLLRLVFHLLSSAPNRGHRTALYNAAFQRLDIRLASGVCITAELTERESIRILVLQIRKGEKLIAEWNYNPHLGRRGIEAELPFGEDEATIIGWKVQRRAGHRSKISAQSGELPYLHALQSHTPLTFILNADRRLDSDSVADPSDEVELRRVMRYGEPKRINELVVRSREIALSQALSAATRWIGRKAVIGTNKGAMNVHSVYGDVLRHLVSPTSSAGFPAASESIEPLLEQLADIDARSEQHARYELATHLPTDGFRKALRARSIKKSALAATLLKPYLQSVQGRLDAVEPIYQLVDRFVTIANALFRDKYITFKLSQGFGIQNSLDIPLEPSQLSSGEQQLLLLFCYVLTARDAPTVFMIDEPEISLNIKWQRRLVQDLLDITTGADIQFIFASHSMELLAQHRKRVVRLVPNQ